GMSGEEYLHMYSREAAKWMNTCVACQRKGYRPDLPNAIMHGTIETAIADNLRTHFQPLPLNQDGLCAECEAALGLRKLDNCSHSHWRLRSCRRTARPFQAAIPENFSVQPLSNPPGRAKNSPTISTVPLNSFPNGCYRRRSLDSNRARQSQGS